MAMIERRADLVEIGVEMLDSVAVVIGILLAYRAVGGSFG
jgi:hypothetical protein